MTGYNPAPLARTEAMRFALPFNATLIAELRKLDDEQILTLLGEIVEPSIYTPFDTSEDFDEALEPITDAYRAAYAKLNAIAGGDA
jgi:hypothetical protein